jgi:hypothetical protein
MNALDDELYHELAAQNEDMRRHIASLQTCIRLLRERAERAESRAKRWKRLMQRDRTDPDRVACWRSSAMRWRKAYWRVERRRDWLNAGAGVAAFFLGMASVVLMLIVWGPA